MTIFSGSVFSHISRADSALNQGDINEALRIVHDFVERIITEPLCTAQVFASSELDKLCLRIGRQSLTKIALQCDGSRLVRNGRVQVVYLVSRLQASGGHSRLVMDFIRAQPNKDHLILSTEVGGPSDKEYLAKVFAGEENVRLVTAPRVNFQSRLEWLQVSLAGSQALHVHLLNHHQDSVAVASLVPELGLQGSFYHHGDHHLSLGVHMGHLTHVDLHPMGYHYCRDQLGIENQYLPLTFEDMGFVPVLMPLAAKGGLTTATAARSNKIEIPYYVSYLDLIPRILKTTGGHHIHIGKLTPWARRRMRIRMREEGVPEGRLIYIEWTSSVWKCLQEQKVDLYLASFPYGAGLTLIEAMGAGVPVIMHHHIYSRVLSGLELAYPGAFYWSDPDKLLSYLAALESDMLKRESQQAREHYEAYHRPELLRAYFQHPHRMQLPVPPLNANFRPRYDEWAAWAEAQLSLFRLFYRFAYRSWRKMRATFS